MDYAIVTTTQRVTQRDRQQKKRWTWEASADGGDGQMIFKDVSFVPELYTIYNDILVNIVASNVATIIRIDIDGERNEISIWHNGKVANSSIGPTIEKSVMVLPTHLEQCNTSSTQFIVEIGSKKKQKRYTQTWQNNMPVANKLDVADLRADEGDFTIVTFQPDLNKFNMTKLDTGDIVGLMSRRAYDVSCLLVFLCVRVLF